MKVRSPFRENCNAREMEKLAPVCLYTVRAFLPQRQNGPFRPVENNKTRNQIYVINSQGRLPLSVIS